MRQYAWCLVFGILIILLVLTILSQHRKRDNKEIEVRRISQILSTGIMCDGLPLETEALKEYLLKNSIEQEAILVIKYSVWDCSKCDQDVMETIEQFFGKDRFNVRIVFLAYGFKTKNEREYGNTIYVNKESSSVIGSINAPVIFVYKDGTTLHTYVPLAKEREEFIHYLSLVRSKYRID